MIRRYLVICGPDFYRVYTREEVARAVASALVATTDCSVRVEEVDHDTSVD